MKIEKMERQKRTITITFTQEDDCCELFWELVERWKGNIKIQPCDYTQKSLTKPKPDYEFTGFIPDNKLF